MSRIADSIKKKGREKSQEGSKGSKTRIPEPKVLRIMERHVGGESNRQIACEEEVDRKTVARVLKSQELQNHIRLQRQRLYGLIPMAVDALEHILKEKKDLRIAYQLLGDTGVIPSLDERMSALTQPPQSLSDEARETLYNSLSESDKLVFRLFRMFKVRCDAYGMPFNLGDTESITEPTSAEQTPGETQGA